MSLLGELVGMHFKIDNTGTITAIRSLYFILDLFSPLFLSGFYKQFKLLDIVKTINCIFVTN